MSTRSGVFTVKRLAALLFILLLLFKTNISRAGEGTYIEYISGTSVIPGAQLHVTDEEFRYASSFYGSIKPSPYTLTPENVVELKLDYNGGVYFYNKKFSVTVNVTILCYSNASDTTQVTNQYNNIKLSIKHDINDATPYQGTHFMKFSGAHKFTVVVNSISSPELGDNIPPILTIEGKTVIKRKFHFQSISTDSTSITGSDRQLFLSWRPVNYPGAEWFDLEYTFIDSTSELGGILKSHQDANTAVPQAVMQRIFRNNSTRVTTSDSRATINLVYKSGFFVFRIRGVQYENEYRTDLDAAEQFLRTEGQWNYKARIGKLLVPNFFKLDGHANGLNWQYSASFAEEGKRKEVTGYFDGIFKNRQNVTLSNAQRRSIVQETIYDAQGRPAIDVLPAPVKDTTIHYFPNFNQNSAGKGYSYKDFVFSAVCRTIPQLMGATAGAARYYSSNNDTDNRLFKKYIPQAEGFPFAVTEYTADNTGRVFAQGGVGKDFQPGTNHETKYFYSKPSQEELDRLFGSEAGNAGHYLKNMVVDPNGQISVSYLNAGGKTVATALAGSSPSNVHALNSNNGTGTVVTRKLLGDADFNRDGAAGALVGNSSFLAAVTGDYKFNYSFTPGRLDIMHGALNNLKICNTCYYDLVITVSDDCSQVLTTVTKAVDAGTLFQTNCSVLPTAVKDSFTIPVSAIGEYNVSYILKISERAISYYDSVHLVQNTNVKPYKSFVLEKLKEADFTDCFSECSTCYMELGTKTDFINQRVKPLFLEADSLAFTTEFNTWAGLLYDSLLANCNRIQSGCATTQTAPCDEEKQLLLSDVKPGGQYALYDSAYQPTDIYVNVMRNYRRSVTFYNEDGSVAMMEVNGKLYNVNDTMNVPWRLFIENFRDSWAESFLPFHPEYCFYQWCLYGTNPASKAFDDEITDILDDSTATAKGYFGAVNSLLNSDPFFKMTGSGSDLKQQMLDSLNLFSRTVHGYSGPAFNIKQFIDYELYCEENAVLPGNCVFPAANSPCRSPYMEWQLYRDYYLELKGYFNEKARLSNPSFANCKNCYIGTDHTEIFTCNPPPATDFYVELDTSYKTGKKIIVRYKNGEEPVMNTIRLTFNYSGGTFKNAFYAGKSAESYIVPVSTGNYYAVTKAECDTATVLTRVPLPRDAVTVKAQQPVPQPGGEVHINATPVSCPCPGAGMFSVSQTNGRCLVNDARFEVTYTGSDIPAGRTVYVDVYWFNDAGRSGITTVSFTTNIKKKSACTIDGSLLLSEKTGITAGVQLQMPLPHILEKMEAVKDSLANLNTPSDTSQTVGLMALPGGFTFYIQTVFCNDLPSFNCPVAAVSLCKEHPLYPHYKDKIRRYDGYQNKADLFQQLSSNYSAYQSQGQADVTAACYTTCEGQAAAWIAALGKCTTDSLVLAQIKAELIQVCVSGCDVDHPYGSSSNPTGTETFETVIRRYIPNASDSCTAELLSDPYPYNRQPSFQNITVIKIDNCLSTRFSELKTQFQGSGFTGSFHQWLQKQLKNDYKLSSQQLTELEASLNGGCKYLKKPLVLPVAFNCSSTSACIDSAKTIQTHNAFLAKYPGMDSTKANYETLLTNYFNHTLGFNLGFEDYRSYINKCKTGTTNRDLLCNQSLTSSLEIQDITTACMSGVFGLAVGQAVNAYGLYVDSVRAAFRNSYTTRCMNINPAMTLYAKLYEYHYTLYYYDQSGNLVKTIPPEGVRPLSDAEVTQVQSNRVNRNGYCFAGAPELNFTANIMTMNRNTTYDAVIDGKYSLESWLKIGDMALAVTKGILSYNDLAGGWETGYSLVLLQGKLVFSAGTAPNRLKVETPLLSSFLTAGTWFHIAITVNHANAKPVKMFINGNEVPLTYLNNFSPVYTILSSYTHKLRIGGAYESGGLTAITGTGIKQFRWYQRELSPSEIIQNAFNNCLTAASETGLVSYIPVNEGEGKVLTDHMNGNVSTISGNTAVSWQNTMSGVYPKHQFATRYQYNSYNQVVSQTTPDADKSSFWYDALGRLVASQNSEQKQPKNTLNSSANRYSYTKYDALGRINEVGEKYSGTALVPSDDDLIPPGTLNPKNAASLASWYGSGSDKQVTFTIYDAPNTAMVTHTTITSLQTANSRKRVVASIYKEAKANTYYDAASHYVYDVSGNVKTLFQENTALKSVEGSAGNGIRQINYDYDLISGKVNRVVYQPGKGDQFIYRYEYDAENRIKIAYTSRNGLLWQQDAYYEYYQHGPLARVELGQHKVQGVDYAYTLQGWLKGINSVALDATKDMGGDGNAAGIYKTFGRDVYGYSLGYHSSDYKPIGGSAANAFAVTFTAPGSVGSGNTGAQLFNGNISNTTVALSKINSGAATGYSYLYDQLNRLLGMKQHNISGTSWSYSTANAGYEEKFSYDANGNIKTLVRKGANVTGMPLAMDNLKYYYYYTNTSNARAEYDPTVALPSNVKSLSNQLARVTDTDPAGNYADDIDTQTAGNYDYDNSGNLIKDVKEGITGVEWTVYGKIKQIKKGTVTINYGYDPSGNRIYKEVLGAPGGNTKQFYIRDAQGNTMALYNGKTSYVEWVEQHLYGSSRLGVWNYGKTIPAVPGAVSYDSMMIGSVNYELTNHLGNVLSVISDKKVGMNTGGTTVDYYRAEVLSQNDYYAFGMMMPGRKYSVANTSYRYGFQNQEIDKELWGGAIHFNYRVEDSRLGRFFSTDPLEMKFPWNSPYAFSENRLIDGVELEGLEFVPVKSNTPGRMTIRAFAYKAIDVEDKWNNSRAGKFTNGLVNTAFGIVGTIGSVAYMAETGGSGAAFGGAIALTLSLGEIGIGLSQMTDAIASRQNNSTDFLHNSSTIPGMIAYGTNSNYAPFIDAFSALGPSFATSGGVRTFLKDAAGLKSAFSSFVESPNILNSLGAIDQLLDVKGFAIESANIFNHFASDGKTLRAQTLSYQLSYSVQEGDVLTTIAKRLNTSVETLAGQNSISNTDEIKVGQTLRYSNDTTEKIKQR